MATSAESVRESVTISKDIATTQKFATELQSRAYLSVFFDSAIYQDVNHVFEATAVIRNHGNTPAYDVVFKATAQIVPVPFPEDFAYPLPDDSAGGSVSLIAPGSRLSCRVRHCVIAYCCHFISCNKTCASRRG